MIEVTEGNSPLVLGLPHTGTEVPDDIWDTFNDTGKALADTDWHIHQLYAELAENITSVRTRIHRYVIDVNRDPGGQSLYPGQNTTTLCPLTDFDGRPIYKADFDTGAIATQYRCETYHAPYHAALNAQLDRVKAIHGFAILYDCHSIRSKIPFLFEGTLPDFNVGTNMGVTCDPQIERLVCKICVDAPGFSSILNGRFKGGWTTRHYGHPDSGLHAIQMELAQSIYMEEKAPWTYSHSKAENLRKHLSAIAETLLVWRPDHI